MSGRDCRLVCVYVQSIKFSGWPAIIGFVANAGRLFEVYGVAYLYDVEHLADIMDTHH